MHPAFKLLFQNVCSLNWIQGAESCTLKFEKLLHKNITTKPLYNYQDPIIFWFISQTKTNLLTTLANGQARSCK